MGRKQFNDDSVSDYQKEKAKAALSKIAEHRDSQGIRKFLDTGMIPGGFIFALLFLVVGQTLTSSTESIDTPREAPTGIDRPAGLQNIGNTCYLNSLLQYFFTIKELREVVLNFDEYQETRPFEEIETSKRVGGRNITRREIERSTQCQHSES